MTALARDRKTDRMGVEDSVQPLLLNFPVAASTKIYAGSLVATNASGYAVPASAIGALKIWGRCERQVDNSAGLDAALTVDVRPGAYFFGAGSGADAVTQASIGALVYAIDDQTIGLTDASGTRPAAGIVYNVRADGQIGVLVGQPSLYAQNPENSPSAALAFKARGVETANVASLAAFTVAGGDGITYVAGDIVFLANQTTASQSGPHVVGTVTTGTAPLTRPDWYPTGGLIGLGTEISIGGEGTTHGGSSWKSFAASGAVIGTSDPVFYPRTVRGTATLGGGGTVTASNLFIRTGAGVGGAETTDATKTFKVVVTAGHGTGSLAFTGTATDVLAYVVANY